MKPLDKECTEQKCWCHKDMGNRSKEDFIEAVHTQDNACEWLEIIADHILALANGGGNEEGNLQTMCKTCNIRKGVKPWLSSGQQTI